MYQKVVIPARCAPLNPGSRLFNRSRNPYLKLDSRFTVRPAGCPGMTPKGFTLIELLVVVLIIGILSAVALPQYQKAVWKSRSVALQIWAKRLFEAQQGYILANGRFSFCLDDLDLDWRSAFPVIVSQTGDCVRTAKQENGAAGILISVEPYFAHVTFAEGKYEHSGFGFTMLEGKGDSKGAGDGAVGGVWDTCGRGDGYGWERILRSMGYTRVVTGNYACLQQLNQ